MKKVYTKFFIIMLMLTLIISLNTNVVHAAPASNVNWNIYLENIEIKEGSVTARTNPVIDESLTGIVYEVDLDTPGQFFEFTMDVKNSGSIDAMLDEVIGTTLTTEQQKYLAYIVTYDGGTSLEKNDKLAVGATEKIKVRIEFKKDVTAEDLPKNVSGIELTLNLNYIPADGNAQEVDDPEEDEDDSESEDDKENQKDDKKESSDSQDSKDIGEKEVNKSNDTKTSNVQTGDNILICFVLISLATVVLIFVKGKEKE